MYKSDRRNCGARGGWIKGEGHGRNTAVIARVRWSKRTGGGGFLGKNVEEERAIAICFFPDGQSESSCGGYTFCRTTFAPGFCFALAYTAALSRSIVREAIFSVRLLHRSLSLSLVVPLSCPFNCGVSRKKKEEQKKQGGVQQWQPLSSRGNASLSIQHFACCRGGPLAVGSRRAAVFRSKEPNTIDKGVARHNEFARWVLFLALTFCVVSTLFSDNSGSAVCGEIGLGNDVEVPGVPLRAASVDN